jgi:RimJ/RimL family protein N-acetyltransferase
VNDVRDGGDVAAAYAGQYVTLRAVSREDYPIFLRWRTDIKELHVWSSIRLVPTVEGFNNEMDLLLSQSTTLLALDTVDSTPIGFIQAFNINPTDGWCMVRAYFAPSQRGHRSCTEAWFAFLDYLLGNFGLRKVYVDLPEFQRGSLEGVIASAFSEEGRFRDHTFYDGRYWDAVRLALYRDAWPELRARIWLILEVGAEATGLLAEHEARAQATP